MAEVLISDNKREYDKNGNGVFVVESVGEIIVTSIGAEESKQGHAPRHRKYIHLILSLIIHFLGFPRIYIAELISEHMLNDMIMYRFIKKK